VSLANTSISGNAATNGGGFYCVGAGDSASLTVDVRNCTMSGNSAILGAGLLNDTLGGQTTLTVANTTFSGNLAASDGGGIWNGGEESGTANLQVLNCTLSGNLAGETGGSIYNRALSPATATLEIGSSILNAGAAGDTITNVSGTIASLGFNLSSDNGGGFLTEPTDQLNTDPVLGPLQDNGGPTFTHALSCGSPAIEQGRNFSASLYDQRGFPFLRTFVDPLAPKPPGGDGTDIGAFESQTVCTTPADAVRHLSDLVASNWKRAQPLLATLDAALASIERNNRTAAINQLNAFQNKVRAQVAPSDPALAAMLLKAAQDIITVLNAR
jgi:hypothetical protein